MSKMFKVFASSVLLISMTFSVGGKSLAAEADQNLQFVTIKEYETAMSQIYAECEIEWSVADASEAEPITQELFEAEISRAEKECEDYKAELSRNKFEILNQEVMEDSGITPFALMPVTANYRMDLHINRDFGGCTISAKSNATYDGQYSRFMSVNSYSFSRTSGTNCTGWSNNGSSVHISSGNLRVRFDGTADFRYRVPVINVEVDESVPFIYGTSWNVNQGGTTVNKWY